MTYGLGVYSVCVCFACLQQVLPASKRLPHSLELFKLTLILLPSIKTKFLIMDVSVSLFVAEHVSGQE